MEKIYEQNSSFHMKYRNTGKKKKKKKKKKNCDGGKTEH